MEQARTSSSAPTAVLAGSLAAFSLVDVLKLLAHAQHAGELQVVSNGVDERLRLDDGDLLDPAGNAASRLFDLACLRDAWFSVTMAPAGTRSANGVRTSLRSLIDQLEPEVAEWRSLVATLPPDAAVTMAPSTPAPQVEIRADQWRVLTTVGLGHTVREVLDAAGQRPLETLRILKQLTDSSLLAVTPPSEAAGVAVGSPPADALSDSPQAERARAAGAPTVPDDVFPSPGAPVAPAPSGPVAAPGPDMPSAQDPAADAPAMSGLGTDGAGAPRVAPAPSPPAFMPPPVTAELWSVPGAADNADHTGSPYRLPA